MKRTLRLPTPESNSTLGTVLVVVGIAALAWYIIRSNTNADADKQA